MTVYLIIGCVLGVIVVYFYGRREGIKTSQLGAAVESIKRSKVVDKIIKVIDEKTNKKIRDISVRSAINFWVPTNGTKKSEDVSGTDKTGT